MENRIANELLTGTLHTVSAVVSLDEAGNVLTVRVFDTYWMAERMEIAPDAAQVMLICNHPDGSTEATAKERENFASLKELAGHVSAKMFLCSEYYPSKEV